MRGLTTLPYLMVVFRVAGLPDCINLTQLDHSASGLCLHLAPAFQITDCDLPEIPPD